MIKKPSSASKASADIDDDDLDKIFSELDVIKELDEADLGIDEDDDSFSDDEDLDMIADDEPEDYDDDDMEAYLGIVMNSINMSYSVKYIKDYQ